MKYKSKIHDYVINAIQWKGKNPHQVFTFVGTNGIWGLDTSVHYFPKAEQWRYNMLHVKTTKGIIKAEFGDYIIKNDEGTYDIVKEDEFNKQYELCLYF